MRLIAYLRVSTDQQADSGAGLDAQLDACSAHAKRRGLEIHQVFRDEGISGAAKLDERPGLMDAISSLKKGDILLVAKRDRLARDQRTLFKIEDAVEKGKRVSFPSLGKAQKPINMTLPPL